MRTALRKIGNSTGMVVPRSILSEIGVTTGVTMDLRVEDGKLIATPTERVAREGWADAAAGIAATAEEQDWAGFANAHDAKLTW